MATKRQNSYYSDLPIHPGEVLADELEARAMTQRALAKVIGRPEQVISEIVRGKKGITAQTALDLSTAFGVSAEFWMGLQASYELTVARRMTGVKRGNSTRTARRGIARKRAATR